MTPNHAIFRHVYAMAKLTSKDVYDYLPDADAKYPFFYIGDTNNSEAANIELYGTASIRVHIYAKRVQRSDVDLITSHFLSNLRNANPEGEYQIAYRSCDQQDLQDNTDVTPLVHRVLDVDFSYTERN